MSAIQVKGLLKTQLKLTVTHGKGSSMKVLWTFTAHASGHKFSLAPIILALLPFIYFFFCQLQYIFSSVHERWKFISQIIDSFFDKRQWWSQSYDYRFAELRLRVFASSKFHAQYANSLQQSQSDPDDACVVAPTHLASR